MHCANRSFIFTVKYFRVPNKTERMQKSFQAKWGWACPWRQKGPVPVSWVRWGKLVDLKSRSFGPKYLLSSRNIFYTFERFRVQGIMVVRLYYLTESHFPHSKYSNLAGLAGVGARKLFYQPPHSHESDVDGCRHAFLETLIVSVCMHMCVCVCVCRMQKKMSQSGIGVVMDVCIGSSGGRKEEAVTFY